MASSTIVLSSPWFEPIRPALSRVSLEPLPDAATLQVALGPLIDSALGEGVIVFEPQEGKLRRRSSIDALYEARVHRLGRVPTRRHLHDTMNALVWATFPRAKRALAERQHRALITQIGDDFTRLPNARTRERDVLAMIDEGGVIVVGGETRIFGHAIYEHLLTQGTKVRGFPIELEANQSIDVVFASWLEAADLCSLRVVSFEVDPAK